MGIIEVPLVRYFGREEMTNKIKEGRLFRFRPDTKIVETLYSNYIELPILRYTEISPQAITIHSIRKRFWRAND